MVTDSPESNSQISFFYELMRKLTHMGGLVIPGIYYIFQLEKGEMLSGMIPITILVILADISRLRNWWFWRQTIVRNIFEPMVRPHEQKGDFTGASYILMSFCLTIALYSKPIALTAIVFIIIGDTFAALIGRKIKSPRFYKNKTIAGSLGCLGGMVSVAIFAPDMTLQVALGGALIGTIFEAFSFGIDDNVTVPILSGLGMTLLEKIVNFL